MSLCCGCDASVLQIKVVICFELVSTRHFWRLTNPENTSLCFLLTGGGRSRCPVVTGADVVVPVVDWAGDELVYTYIQKISLK